jgi:hypothetical protein
MVSISMFERKKNLDGKPTTTSVPDGGGFRHANVVFIVENCVTYVGLWGGKEGGLGEGVGLVDCDTMEQYRFQHGATNSTVLWSLQSLPCLVQGGLRKKLYVSTIM